MYQAQHANERQQVLGLHTLQAKQADARSDIERPDPQKEFDYRAYYDLKSQQDMSEWTYSLLWVGIIGLLASAIGIGFVYANLREMQAQTELDRGVGENQVRAFVHASAATLIVGGSGRLLLASVPHLVSIEVRNTGNTPAFAIDARAKLYVTGLADNIDEIDMELDQERKIDAIAGSSTGSLSFQLSGREYRVRPRPPNLLNVLQTGLTDPEEQKQARNALSPLDDAKSVICRGRVQYRDIFGDEFESEFEFTHFGIPSEGDKPMILRSKGLRLFHKIRNRDESIKKDV